MEPLSISLPRGNSENLFYLFDMSVSDAASPSVSEEEKCASRSLRIFNDLPEYDKIRYYLLEIAA